MLFKNHGHLSANNKNVLVSSILFSYWNSHNWGRKHWVLDTKEAQDIKLLDLSHLDVIYSMEI